MGLTYIKKITPPSAECAASAPALLLLLHGTGADEFNLLPLVDIVVPPNVVVASLRAPLNTPFGGYRWFSGYSSAPDPAALRSEIGASCDEVYDFIQAAPSTLGIDPDRVYLLGFSQGATTVWTALLSRWPRAGFISGALALSGRLMPDLKKPGTPLGARLAPAAQLATTRVFASHGAADDVTPLRMGLQNVEHFTAWLGEEAAASILTWREYEHDGHEIGAGAVRDAKAWLAAELAI